MRIYTAHPAMVDAAAKRSAIHYARALSARPKALSHHAAARLQQTVHGPTITAVEGRAANRALTLSVYVPRVA